MAQFNNNSQSYMRLFKLPKKYVDRIFFQLPIDLVGVDDLFKIFLEHIHERIMTSSLTGDKTKLLYSRRLFSENTFIKLFMWFCIEYDYEAEFSIENLNQMRTIWKPEFFRKEYSY